MEINYSIPDKIPQFDGGADEKNVDNPSSRYAQKWYYIDREGNEQVLFLFSNCELRPIFVSHTRTLAHFMFRPHAHRTYTCEFAKI